MKNEIKLYRFKWKSHQPNPLEGLLIATPQQVEQQIGKFVYFGEILDSTQRFYGWLEAEDFEVLPVPLQAVIELRESLGNRISGVYPFDYIVEEEEEE